MSAPLTPTKTEMDAFFVPLAAEGASFRFSNGFFELKDAATEQFAALSLANGNLTIGEPTS